jgi:hypothetical protein
VQHSERGRPFAAAANGQLTSVVYASLGMQDAHLPLAVADLIAREAVAT